MSMMLTTEVMTRPHDEPSYDEPSNEEPSYDEPSVMNHPDTVFVYVAVFIRV